MEFEKEILRIIEYMNSRLCASERMKPDAIKELAKSVVDSVGKKEYDFSDYKTISLRTNGKVRTVMNFELWSKELLLCIYLKRRIDKCFHVKYPNRNNQVHTLFGIISAIQDMKDFVIVKFDFEDFFNSLSSSYIYENYIKDSSMERQEKEIIKDFISSCAFCYAGINTSNVFAEIIARDFDLEVKKQFMDSGLIFFERYVDDGVLIFNRFISEDECKQRLNNAISAVFLSNDIKVSTPCTTRLNSTKFKYISRRNVAARPGVPHDFDFLGYGFSVCSVNTKGKSSISISYGITEEKIKKYMSKIDLIVQDYKKNRDTNILRHKLKCFVSRIVYRRRRYSQMIWIAKGFISNYNELRFHISQLDALTESFLKDAIKNAFSKSGVDLPYFLKDDPLLSRYSLYFCLAKNKTLLFEENKRIGIGLQALKKMCTEIGVKNIDGKRYNALVREYLIALGIGH